MRQAFALMLLAALLAHGGHLFGQNQNHPDRQDRTIRQDRTNQRDRQDRTIRQDRTNQQDRQDRTIQRDRTNQQDRQDRTIQRDQPNRRDHSFPTELLRLYEDDDFINIKGKGTDEAYTDGSRVDLFYTRNSPPHWFLDRALPRAGDSSTDVFGWGIMQAMYTPRKIDDPDFQPDDYPWAGELFLTHSLYSYNPKAKYDLQTAVVAGVVGPASLAGPTQKAFHHLIHYRQPMGWKHQFRNDLLLNINLTLEKQLLAIRAGANPLLEIIGGGTIHAGTMENKLSVYSLLRIGKMNPYFDGLMSQYSGRRRIQLYFFARPEADLVSTNAILEGGMFTHPPHGTKEDGAAAAAMTNSQPGSPTAAFAASQSGGPTGTQPGGIAGNPSSGSTNSAQPGGSSGDAQSGGSSGDVQSGGSSSGAQPGSSQTGAHAGAPGTNLQAAAARSLTSYHPLHSYVYSIDYGAVLALRSWSISFTQSWNSPLMKGLYNHEVGNLSLYISL